MAMYREYNQFAQALRDGSQCEPNFYMGSLGVTSDVFESVGLVVEQIVARREGQEDIVLCPAGGLRLEGHILQELVGSCGVGFDDTRERQNLPNSEALRLQGFVNRARLAGIPMQTLRLVDAPRADLPAIRQAVEALLPPQGLTDISSLAEFEERMRVWAALLDFTDCTVMGTSGGREIAPTRYPRKQLALSGVTTVTAIVAVREGRCVRLTFEAGVQLTEELLHSLEAVGVIFNDTRK